jgi:hypothetical protein
VSGRRWLAAAVGVVVAGVVVAVLLLNQGGPVRPRSPVGTTHDYLAGRGSPVVAFDSRTGEVVAAVRGGPGACTDEASRLNGSFNVPELATLIRAVPDPRLGELLIDEEQLVRTSLAACASGSPAASSDASQLATLHDAIHGLMAAS